MDTVGNSIESFDCASCSLALLQSSLSALGFPSSHEIRPLSAPPSTLIPDVHSRNPRAPSVEQHHLLDPVPPSWFLTTLTASSIWMLRACCIPLPTMRFAVFPLRSVSPPRGDLYPARLPHDALTLRRIPLVSSRTASPQPLPSCRFHSLRHHLKTRNLLTSPHAHAPGIARVSAPHCCPDQGLVTTRLIWARV